MYLPINLAKKFDEKLYPLGRFLYKLLGITPSSLTFLSLVSSALAALMLYYRDLLIGLSLVALSLIFDGLQSTIVRQYSIASKKIEIYDLMSDRASEFLLFTALALNGSVAITLAVLSYYAIILNTLLRKKTNVDLGFKRMPLLFGYFINFNIIFTVIFFVNLLSFIVQISVLDYKTTKAIKSRYNKGGIW